MILDSQKYQNTTRTITGLVNFVFNTDTIVICDTTLGPVQIELLEIPANSWNTTRKFYFLDSGNATTNNITITAPAGFTINGQSTLVLNANNQNALVRVGSNTDYLAYTSTGNGSNLAVLNQGVQITPSASSMNFLGIQATAVGNAVTIQNNFISGTYAQISALATANNLIPSQSYAITNALYGSLPTTNIAVYLEAISVNELSLSGSGYFFNADYDGAGVYTGVPGFVAQLGIWSLTLLPVVGDVCIWNNLHYRNTTGANGLTNPQLDAVNWSLLSYSATNGYIVEIDSIDYNFATNRIIKRSDVRLNSVEWCTSFVGYDSFNNFRWGDNKCLNNILLNSVLYNCNNIVDSLFNFLSNSSVVNGSATSGGSANFVQNQFIDSTISIPFQSLGGEALLLNNIQNSQVFFTKNNFTLVDSGNFARNTINNSTFSSITFEGQYIYNIFENCTSTTLNQTRIGSIGYNSVRNSNFDVTDNSGNILTNDINSNSAFNITGQNTSNIASNCISFSSSMTIVVNSSTIQNNVLNSSAQLNLANNSNLVLNNFLFDSTFTSGTAQTGRLIGNTIYQSVLNISNCNGNFSDNTLKNTSITIVTLSVAISENNVNNGTLNLTNVTTAISGGIYIEGISTMRYVLDLNDPTIFNAGTLTIPNGLAFFFGEYTLLNCAGQNITKIVNSNPEVPIRLIPDANTVILTRTAVGAAVANDIISSTAVASWTLTFRINGCDSIQLRRLGNLNGVIETEIYV